MVEARNRGQAEQTRKRLLDTAEKLFAEKGFDAVSIREITSKAEVHLGSVNYHFGSKKELYHEIFKTRWLERAQRVRQPLKDLEKKGGQSPESVIKAIVGLIMSNPLSDEERWIHSRLIMRELSRPTEAFEIMAQNHMRPTVELIGRLINNSMGGTFSEEESMLNALSVVAQAIYFNNARVVVSRLTGNDTDEESYNKRLVEHVTGFSLRGVGAEER